MMIPIKCFSCGRVIASDYEKFREETITKKRNPEEVLDELNIERYCCRRMILSQVDMYKDMNKFYVK